MGAPWLLDGEGFLRINGVDGIPLLVTVATSALRPRFSGVGHSAAPGDATGWAGPTRRPPVDWTTPGIEEVAPGVHRIPLPMPTDGLRAVNVYAVLAGAGAEGNTLIDGGWKIEPAVLALDAALATLGLAAADFGQCLVTHHHRDHYTLAVELRRRVGMTISLGEGERANMQVAYADRPVAFGSQLTSLVDAGAQAVLTMLRAARHESVDRFDYEPPDVWLADADRIDASGRTLRVVATPGHTSGHVVFVDDDANLMFSGDHVLPHITPSVGLQSVPALSPLADFLSSLARVVAEPDRVMLPAHGPAGGSVHERASELIAHHEKRLTDTAGALVGGASTAYDVARQLRWTSRGRHLDELDAFNQMLAVMETVAHLDVLRAQGRVSRSRPAGDPWVYAG